MSLKKFKVSTRGIGFLLLVSLCCLISLTALAQNSNAVPFSLQTLLQQFSEAKTFSVPFKQSRYLSFSNNPSVTTGTMSYRSPDYIEQHTSHPIEQLVIIQGNKVTLSQPGKATRHANIQQYPALYMPLLSLKMLMRADLNTLQSIYHVELLGDENNWTIRLTPLENHLRKKIAYIDLGGIKKHVKQFVVAQPNGQRIVVDFK